MESGGRSVRSQVFLPPKRFPPAKVVTISGVGLMLLDVFRFFHKENRRRFAREWRQNRKRSNYSGRFLPEKNSLARNYCGWNDAVCAPLASKNPPE